MTEADIGWYIGALFTAWAIGWGGGMVTLAIKSILEKASSE